MKYPPTRYKEHIVEIWIILTDEHTLERMKDIIYGAGKDRETDVMITMFEKQLQFISSHDLFRKDPPFIIIPPRVVDAKIPKSTIQAKEMEVTVRHLLQLLVKLDVRDEDVQSEGVYTAMHDAGTTRATPTRHFHIQLTANQTLPRISNVRQMAQLLPIIGLIQ